MPTVAVLTIEAISDATEGGATGVFRVSRTGDPTDPLYFLATVTGGTATPDTDYTHDGNSPVASPLYNYFQFAGGASTVDIPITPVDDSAYEGTETVTLALLEYVNCVPGDPSSATLSIIDNDPAPVVTVETVADGVESGTNGTLRFTRSGGDLSQSLTVSYTIGGTADDGDDYTGLSGIVTFGALQNNADVTVTIFDDSELEGVETIDVYLMDGDGYLVGESFATTISMIDDDLATVSVIASGSSSETGPESGQFIFTREGGDLSQPLTVTYQTAGTATSGTDYTALSGTVTFLANEPTTSVDVSPINDAVMELPETLILTLETEAGYTSSPEAGEASLVVRDDDAGTIGGVVWADDNADGIRNGAEEGVEEVTVRLLAETGEFLAETTTAADGSYAFAGVLGGSYLLAFDTPWLNTLTTPDQGNDEALDSDADPETHQAGPITISAGNELNLVVGAGLLEAAPPPTPSEPTVLIVKPDGTPVGTAGVRVAKWSDAFEPLANVPPPKGGGPAQVKVRGPNDKGHDFIDRDPDRFNVWVYDMKAWNAGAQTVDVKLSTTNVAGFEKYNDDPTKLRLVRIGRQGFDGWYWSDSQLLVSNTVDDEYSDANIAPDESDPLPGAVNKKENCEFPVTDRTHKVALGATVKAEYNTGVPDAQGKDIIKTAQTGVPVQKTLKLNVHIMREVAGGKKTAVTKAEVEEDLVKVREILAQVGIRVTVPNPVDIYDPPENVDLRDWLELRAANRDPIVDGADALSKEEKALLGSYRTKQSDDIEVYYINRFTTTTMGRSYAKAWVSEAYGDSIVVRALRYYNVTAHEIIHVLTTDGHYQWNIALEDKIDTINLMVDGERMVVENKVTDSRRLTEGQQTRAYANGKHLLS